tara:strand:+ start:3194 stop:3895 length:702 start_codon:yes stop_codon:yes gene_type:complete
MSRSNKIKWKRILNDLGYLYEEMALIEDLEKETNNQFESYYRAFCAERKIDIDKLNNENHEKICEMYNVRPIEEIPSASEYEGDASLLPVESEQEMEELFDEEQAEHFKELHDDFNKLFKKIAMKLHPDRIDNFILDDETNRKQRWDFSKAKQCLDKKRYFHLVKIAQKYNILIPENYALQLRWFKKEKEKITNEIEAKKGTYNYSFAECATDQERDDLVRRFIYQLFRINVP